MEIFSFLADIIGIGSAIVAILAWVNTIKIKKSQTQEKERLDQEVSITLINKDKPQDKIKLPGKIRRGDVTRSEVLGWIGMLPMRFPGGRFGIEYNNSPAFFSQLHEIHTGTKVNFEILCTQQEMEQFKQDKEMK